MLKTCALVILALLSGGALTGLSTGGRASAEENTLIRVTDTLFGAELEAEIGASVPFRVFTLADPPRVVADFAMEGWPGTTALGPDLADDPIAAVRIGLFRPGQARLVADLTGPVRIESAVLEGGVFRMRLESEDAETFAAGSGAPAGAIWATGTAPEARPLPRQRRLRVPGEPLIVMLDPGHGGIDPGAIRGGLREKDLVLRAAREIAAALSATGRYIPVLTREDDRYLALAERVALARRTGADVFISLHINTVTRGEASGLSVYSLSEQASDSAAERYADLENRADILAGVDLEGESGAVTRILVDLAQRDTNVRSRALARAIVEQFNRAGGTLRSKPHREAGFRVLKAPDIPSVLIELGFLSDPRDRRRMVEDDWGSEVARDLIAALDDWGEADMASRRVVRH